MFTQFLVAVVMSISTTVFASSTLSENDVLRLKEQASPIILAMQGVNGIGVSSCKHYKTHEPCLIIMTKNNKTAIVLRQLYPENARVSGILVKIENIGIIRAQ